MSTDQSPSSLAHDVSSDERTHLVQGLDDSGTDAVNEPVRALAEPAAGSGTNPTEQAYGEFQYAYDHYNRELFNGILPPCLITLQRKANCMGYFSFKRFVRQDGKTTDEIALNPEKQAGVTVIETLSTLVHEMVHLWQFHFGTPGRRGYHNQEWAEKMEEVGLMPSNTGRPGGKKVGEKMTHYIIPEGRFTTASKTLLGNDFKLTWNDRFPTKRMLVDPVRAEGIDAVQVQLGVPVVDHMHKLDRVQQPRYVDVVLPKKSTRDKYRCDGCGAQVWGKPGLDIRCMKCSMDFKEVD